MSRQAVLDAAAQLAAEKFGVDSWEVFAPGRAQRAAVTARHWAYIQLHDGKVPGQPMPWTGLEIARALKRECSTINLVIRKVAAERAKAVANGEDPDICQFPSEGLRCR